MEVSAECFVGLQRPEFERDSFLPERIGLICVSDLVEAERPALRR